MIAYSIEAAKDTELFDRIIVSTDCPDIAKIAEGYGAEVPFMRPPELSDDHTATAPVLEHTLHWLKSRGENPQYACCIYATAPFIQVNFLKEGLKNIETFKCSSSFAVTSFPFPIFRGLRIENGCLSMFWPEHELTRSQDLPEAYHDAGQFYWFAVPPFLQSLKIYTEDARPIILPRKFVQDIDTPEDWEQAEVMYQTMIVAAEEKHETGD